MSVAATDPDEDTTTDDAAEGSDGTVEVHTGGSVLAIRPDQTELTTEQRATLAVIGLDWLPPAEAAWFLHGCQMRNLDPFLGEITVIRTMDGLKLLTTIDGLRRAAMSTGEYEGMTPVEWCDEDGQWFDVWPKSKPGRPYGSRVAVHRASFREPTYAVVYTHEVQVTENVEVRDQIDGQTVVTWEERPVRRWQEGQRVCGLIAKCAKAAAFREAFPRQTNGVYVAEEMERLREETRRAQAADRASERVRAQAEVAETARAARDAQEPIEGVVLHETEAPRRAEKARPPREDVRATIDRLKDLTYGHGNPVPARRPLVPPRPEQEPVTEPAAPEVPADVMPEAEKVACLRAELAEQADALGLPDTSKLTARMVTSCGQPVDEWDAARLLSVVAPMRIPVAAALAKRGDSVAAASYRSAGTALIAPVEVLFGRI